MYEDIGLSCPLMGGKPCMGRECACAVGTKVDEGEVWTCGLTIPCGNSRRFNIVGIERVDELAKED